MSKWKPLRTADASAKQMLKEEEEEAQAWQVPAEEITNEAVLYFDWVIEHA